MEVDKSGCNPQFRKEQLLKTQGVLQHFSSKFDLESCQKVIAELLAEEAGKRGLLVMASREAEKVVGN
jgi:hypothetical protein